MARWKSACIVALALVLARHPALHSIGVTVLFGIGIAIPAALLVIPALYQKNRENMS